EFHDTVLLDRGYREAELRRRALYLVGPDCWIIWDETAKPMRIFQNWQVDLGVTARRNDRGFELRSRDQSVTMAWLGHLPTLRRHAATEGDLRGWIATKWKTLEPASLITAETPSNRQRSVVIVAPYAPTEYYVGCAYVNVLGTPH